MYFRNIGAAIPITWLQILKLGEGVRLARVKIDLQVTRNQGHSYLHCPSRNSYPEINKAAASLWHREEKEVK